MWKTLKLWQFNLATIALFIVIFGVEGVALGLLVPLVAWLTNRRRADGEKDYSAALIAFAVAFILTWAARH